MQRKCGEKTKGKKDTLSPSRRSQQFCDSTNAVGENDSCDDVQPDIVHGDVQSDIAHGDVQLCDDLLGLSLREIIEKH